MKKKAILAIVSMALVLCCVIGGSLAWLTDKTEEVKNTFTVGDINIDLTESQDLDLKMVPGNTIKKDPTVTVKADSEACWLFVKVIKSDNFDAFMTYEVDEGWTALTGETGVYFRQVAATAEDTSFAVLADDIVTVSSDVTKEQLNALEQAEYPTLTFKAYAVQKANIADATTAWGQVSD